MNEINLLKLSTDRLELIAATLDHVCAELKAPECLASLLNAQVESGWPPGEYDRAAQEFFRDRLQASGMSAVGWYGWYAVRRESCGQPSVLIGAGGYIGPPNEGGEVEIGFSVMPAWQNSGYATEICHALVENALADVRVQRVIAHASPTNGPSCRVLEKCRFHHTGADEESGHWRFEILRNNKRISL